MNFAEYVGHLSPECDFLVPDISGSFSEDEGPRPPPLYKPSACSEKLNATNVASPINFHELFQFPKPVYDEQSCGAIPEILDLDESEYLECCLPSICRYSVCDNDLRFCGTSLDIASNSAQPDAANCMPCSRGDHVSLLSISCNSSRHAGIAFQQRPAYDSSSKLCAVRKVSEETSGNFVESDLSCAFENVPMAASDVTVLDPPSEYQQCLASILPAYVSDQQLEGMEGLISASCSTISSNNEALEDDGAYIGNSSGNSLYSVPTSGVLPPDMAKQDAGLQTSSFSTSKSARNTCNGASIDGKAGQIYLAWVSNSENCEGYVSMNATTRGATRNCSKESSAEQRADETCWSSIQQQENPMWWCNMRNSKLGAQQNESLGAAIFSPSSPSLRSLNHPTSGKRGYVAASHASAAYPLPCAKEMLYRAAALQPLKLSSETKRPTRRNVKISKDPQSVAARHRRERISEKIRVLQRLVPGGTKMDTASMLDEAVQYLKFLKMQVHAMSSIAAGLHPPSVIGSMFSNYTVSSEPSQTVSPSDGLSCLRTGQSSCFNEIAQPSGSRYIY